MNRRRWILLAIALTLVAACTSTTVVLTRGGGEAEAQQENPVMTPSSTASSTTVVSTTTTPLPALPVPDAPPQDPYEDVPVTQIGAIYIPKIGLQHAIYEGVWLTVLDEGPGHWPNSALPGERGNTVFPGHRVTHSHPFLDLDQLAPGDQIVFQMADADDVYEVTETLIVKPTDMWVLDQTETPTVTLIACHPKHSAAQRIVVKGTLVASLPKPA